MIKKICVSVFLFFCLILTIVLCSNVGWYIEILKKCFEQEIVLSNNLYTLICTIIAFIFILITLDTLLVVYKKKDGTKGINYKIEDGTYGTSNWLTEETMRSILGYQNNKSGLILGKYKGEIVRLPFESYFNKNIAVFGSSGSMKTLAFLVTNLLELSKHKKSMILTDPKGEIYQKTSTYFRAIGYEVKVFNLKDMKHSDRWNPLLEIEKIDDVQTAADVIISNTQKKDRGGDEFWPRAEENLLKAFMIYFLEQLSDQNNLTSIYKNIANLKLDDINDIFSNMHPDSPARMSYNIFASGSDTIKASVITGLGTRLQIFQNEDLQKLTSESDIDLTLPAQKPCIYYIISSDMDSTFDFISSLFFTFLFIKLVRYADSRPNGKCDVEVFCMLDEFCNIGQIPDFNKKISTVRSRGIALIPIVQNLGQLQNRYPLGLADEIIGNCDTRLGLGMTDVLTAQYFSDLIGITTVETESFKKSNSIEGDIEEFGQKNISTLQRNLMNVDEILRIPSSKLLVNLRGNNPIILDKMIYTEHELSKKLKESSILEYNPKWRKRENKAKQPEIKKQESNKKEEKQKKEIQYSKNTKTNKIPEQKEIANKGWDIFKL